MNRGVIEGVVAKLDAVRRRTQQQHRNAFAITFFQRCVSVDVQFADRGAEPSSKRPKSDAHVVAKMAVGARQQRQNGSWVHRSCCRQISEKAIRLFFQIFGVIYALVALTGFFTGNQPLLGMVAINAADNWLHVLIAIVALYLGFGMKAAEPAAAMTTEHHMAGAASRGRRPCRPQAWGSFIPGEGPPRAVNCSPSGGSER